MDETTVAMRAWNLRYDRIHEINKRRHSPACTEALMKGYRCMKKHHGVRDHCQHLLDALYQCRNFDEPLSDQQNQNATAEAASITTDATA